MPARSRVDLPPVPSLDTALAFRSVGHYPYHMSEPVSTSAQSQPSPTADVVIRGFLGAQRSANPEAVLLWLPSLEALGIDPNSVTPPSNM